MIPVARAKAPQRMAFPLFKGATRTPTVGGVPVKPLFGMLMLVAILAMCVSLWLWALAAPLWGVMAAVTRTDDRAFDIAILWIDTKVRNGWRVWRASSYAPLGYDKNRPWRHL